MTVEKIESDPFKDRLFSGRPLAELLLRQAERAHKRRKRAGFSAWSDNLEANVQLTLAECTPLVPRVNWGQEDKSTAALEVEAFDESGFYLMTSPSRIMNVPFDGDERLLLLRPSALADDPWPYESTATDGRIHYIDAGESMATSLWQGIGQHTFDAKADKALQAFRIAVRQMLLNVSAEIDEWRLVLDSELR